MSRHGVIHQLFHPTGDTGEFLVAFELVPEVAVEFPAFGGALEEFAAAGLDGLDEGFGDLAVAEGGVGGIEPAEALVWRACPGDRDRAAELEASFDRGAGHEVGLVTGGCVIVGDGPRL